LGKLKFALRLLNIVYEPHGLVNENFLTNHVRVVELAVVGVAIVARNRLVAAPIFVAPGTLCHKFS
jgi:hypothetical protein